MSRKHIGLTVAAALFAALSGQLQAAELVPLKFEHPAVDAEESLRIWKGFGDDEIVKNAEKLDVFTAKATTPAGDQILVSQLNGFTVCGDVECPVRIQLNGEIVYDGGGCRYTEDYFLNPSMNTLFMCDFAVPIVAGKAE